MGLFKMWTVILVAVLLAYFDITTAEDDFDGCVDKIDFNGYETYCQGVYKDYLIKNCAQTCNFCDVGGADCKDDAGWCGSRYCSSKYKSQCKKTCGLCGGDFGGDANDKSSKRVDLLLAKEEAMSMKKI